MQRHIWRALAVFPAALLGYSRKTDSLRPAKSVEFLFRLAPPAAAFALFGYSRKTDSLRPAKSVEFLFRLAPPAAAFALFGYSRKTDSLRPAKSAEFLFRLVPPAAAFALLIGPALGQSPLNWEQVRESFRQNNPNLITGRTNIEETRTAEITAGLRPNPQLSLTIDQWNFFATNPFRPFGNSQTIGSVSQLIERRNKRGLRVDSARLATEMSTTDLSDLERTLLFNLRDAFVRALQAKSILELAEQNMAYYDNVIDVNRRRFEAGDVSRSDYDRIAIQRSQYQGDLETARINMRTAKIQLLSLMNDHRSVDAFDIAGPFDFTEKILLPEELHQLARDSRGDVRSAETAIRKAEVDNRLAWANGSTDPTVGGDYTRIGPDNTLGIDVSISLRIFDKNQGEKARTALEIRRSQQNLDAVLNGVYRDIDSAYAQAESVRVLLRPYKNTYLPQAERIRESVSYAYSRGGVSLLDFLDGQKAYRDTQLAYRNLIASYLSAANQLNLAVGQEVLQ